MEEKTLVNDTTIKMLAISIAVYFHAPTRENKKGLKKVCYSFWNNLVMHDPNPTFRANMALMGITNARQFFKYCLSKPWTEEVA